MEFGNFVMHLTNTWGAINVSFVSGYAIPNNKNKEKVQFIMQWPK